MGRTNPPYYLTAYGLAVQNGFKGTVQEWLASLIGPRGRDGDSCRVELIKIENGVQIEVRNITGADTVPGAIKAQIVRIYNGEKGDKGDTPRLSIGTVTTLDAGMKATAEFGGTVAEPVLNLGIPKGPPDGDSCSVTTEDDTMGGGILLTFNNVKGGVASQEKVFLRHGDSSRIDVEEMGTGYKLTVTNTKGGAIAVEEVTLKHGGHYIPIVTQPKDNILQFNWQASDADMPDRPPEAFVLPSGSGGGKSVHIGPEPPTDTSMLWIDTSDDTEDEDPLADYYTRTETDAAIKSYVDTALGVIENGSY